MLRKYPTFLSTIRSGLPNFVLLYCRYNAVEAVISVDNFRLNYNQLTGTVPPELTSRWPTSSSTWSNNCLANTTTTLRGCDLPERPALVDFFVSTAGPTWLVSTGWMTSAHPCTWLGITCLGASLTSGPIV